MGEIHTTVLTDSAQLIAIYSFLNFIYT